MNIKKSTHKLGVARQIPQSRIWLEGARLTAAGFLPGMVYSTLLTERDGKPALILSVSLAPLTASLDVRKITDKAGQPVIDIVGAFVRDNFAKHGTHVDVAYGKGRITITPAAK